MISGNRAGAENLQMEDLLDQELQNAGKLSVEDVAKELEQTEKGQTRQSIQNCVAVLQKDPVLAGSIRRNELTDKTEIVKDVGWKRRGEAITDTDVNQIRLYLEKHYGLTREKQIRAALDIVSSENSFHPIRDYLNALVWDGVERIRHLLPKYLGAEESNYVYEVTKLMMLGAISRVFHPGCKFEIMLCLVGGQGAGKSTLLRFLAIRDEWFTDDLRRLFAPVQIDADRAEHHPLENEQECRKYIIDCWAEAMTLYRSGDFKLTFPKEMEETVRAMQTEYMPDDSTFGVIQHYLETFSGNEICAIQLYEEAFNQTYDPRNRSVLQPICNTMNAGMPGWSTKTKSHRFANYGTQRAWTRLTDGDGFAQMPEDAKIPF